MFVRENRTLSFSLFLFLLSHHVKELSISLDSVFFCSPEAYENKIGIMNAEIAIVDWHM